MIKNRTKYYESLKRLARDLRAAYGFSTPRVRKSDLRLIYKNEGIQIDKWPPVGNGNIKAPKLKSLRGAYFNDENGKSILISRYLPEDPYVFTLAHELKHHFVDTDHQYLYCGDQNISEAIEIGAEIFAAELIFPEGDFLQLLDDMDVLPNTFSPEHLVRLKHETKTTLSYAGLAKRAVFFQLSPEGSLVKVKWKKLEEQIYGVPLYKKIIKTRMKRLKRYRMQKS